MPWRKILCTIGKHVVLTVFGGFFPDYACPGQQLLVQRVSPRLLFKREKFSCLYGVFSWLVSRFAKSFELLPVLTGRMAKRAWPARVSRM
jgi:hypothetical protein